MLSLFINIENNNNLFQRTIQYSMGNSQKYKIQMCMSHNIKSDKKHTKKM